MTSDGGLHGGESAAAAESESSGEEHHESEEVYAVLLPWFVQAVGIVVYYILTRYLHHIPYTAVMFILGIFMGLGASLSGLDDQLSTSIRLWTNIDYEVLFTVFLPGLLFKDALEVNFHLFQASIWQLLTLAFPLVLAGAALTALVAMYVFPYGWSMNQCLTLGSILAATDPVAVSALLNEVGAPPRLKVHVSGESMLNDGSAVVFFYVFGGLFLNELGMDALGGDSTVGEAFTTFFRMSLGGVSVGLAFALGLVYILFKLDRRMEREETILQVTATVTMAYLCFYTSEVVCRMSGVIAVVTCGIATKAFGGGVISDWQVMDSFWGLLEHLLNSLIFALGGIVFGEIVGRGGDLWNGTDWGYLIVLYLFLNAIRFFLNFVFFPINSRIGLGTNWRETVFSSWGGLRGAVGITLALALDKEVFASTSEDDPARALTTKMFGMVGGIALLTLVINGTTCGPMLKKLGIGDATESRRRIVQLAEEATRRRVLDDFLHLMTDRRFYFVDFALVAHHCPILDGLTAEELGAAVEQNKQAVHPSLYKAPHLEHVLPYIKDSAAVRASIVRAKRDFFTASVTSLELGLPTTAEEEEPVEGTPAAAEPPSPALVQDTRLMFVELLRAAYTSQIKDGELDPREYDGFLLYSFFSGLDFAQDAISTGKPLSDWEASQIGSTQFVLKTDNFFSRTFRCCHAGKKGPSKRLEEFKDEEPFQYQKLRLDVLRALSFIDAHKEAQDRLQDELGGGSGDAAAAFRIVMGESRAEVRKAQEVLISKNKKKLNHVISHYLCIILQNKAARYVKLLLDSGVLLQREVRHFLEEIDGHIIKIRKCPLDKHPGSIDFVDEVDVDQQDADAGANQVGARRPRRRKRIKQKSIL